MYEIGKFMVYKFTVYIRYVIYSKLLILTVTDQSVRYYTFALLTFCFLTNYRELLHFYALFTCTRKTCCNIIWHLLHCC